VAFPKRGSDERIIVYRKREGFHTGQCISSWTVVRKRNKFYKLDTKNIY